MSDPINLDQLDFLPYLDRNGLLPESLQGQVGVYAIFDDQKVLHLVGLSRDIALSLRQHLVRRPQQCYWVKVQTVDRPNRTYLESIRADWIQANGSTPIGNGSEAEQWNQPIQVKPLMTPEEQAKYADPYQDELSRIKLLKSIARRVEAEVLAQLQARGAAEEIRFNPKLKEEGLLDLK